MSRSCSFYFQLFFLQMRAIQFQTTQTHKAKFFSNFLWKADKATGLSPLQNCLDLNRRHTFKVFLTASEQQRVAIFPASKRITPLYQAAMTRRRRQSSSGGGSGGGGRKGGRGGPVMSFSGPSYFRESFGLSMSSLSQVKKKVDN